MEILKISRDTAFYLKWNFIEHLKESQNFEILDCKTYDEIFKKASREIFAEFKLKIVYFPDHAEIQYEDSRLLTLFLLQFS